MQQAPSSTCATPGVGRRIVIAGGGYAGTTLAVNLGRKLKGVPDVEIMLIEPNPCQQALSELDLVAVGPARSEFCELWHPTVFKDLPVTVCYNRLDAVHSDEHVVTVGPRGEATDTVPYWRLAIATGAIAFVPPVPGLKEHAVTMWSVADAQELQRRGEVQFRAAVKLKEPAERTRALSFTVIGGGATGVEIVGTLAQLLPKRMRAFGLDPADLRVRLIEGRPDILFDLPKSLRERAKKRLARLGVELFTGSMVSRVEENGVHLEDGSVIDSAVLVFCGGAKADPDAVSWGLEADPGGRLVTSETCKSPAHDDIYIVGDVAAFRDPATNKTIPMLAQFAIREAEHTAENIVREVHGQAPTPFQPNMHGEFVSVGPSWGVGWMFGMNLSGLPAIIMKRLTYVLYWWQVGGVSLASKRLREMLSMHR
ncbi:MAG: NAD(P)/FAD-dependent oxidoreductase [Coriobacteriia bacterium]|nr:NAD(P)/FAD-dependent oxidoreductase [Coriobacteriia bacterium]MBN2821940.1 NAD(P)/FAD-dependent oxidoreductase [Coriobacteriia bacterium]